MTIADEAIKLVGTRFVHQGSDPQIGLDCRGLVVAAGRLAGVVLPVGPAYGQQPSDELFMEWLPRFADRVSADGAARDNILLFCMAGKGPTHAGISIGGGSMVQCNRAHGVHVDTLGRAWLRLLHSVWRFKETC